MNPLAATTFPRSTTDWVQCPVCGESDMQRTSDEEGQALIACVNHACASNGGANRSQMASTAVLAMKPMSSAPRPGPDEYFKLLVLDEWTEMGQPCRGWALVYWLDAFDGRPAGWHGQNCGDLRHPVGWVLTTSELPAS